MVAAVLGVRPVGLVSDLSAAIYPVLMATGFDLFIVLGDPLGVFVATRSMYMRALPTDMSILNFLQLGITSKNGGYACGTPAYQSHNETNK